MTQKIGYGKIVIFHENHKRRFNKLGARYNVEKVKKQASIHIQISIIHLVDCSPFMQTPSVQINVQTASWLHELKLSMKKVGFTTQKLIYKVFWTLLCPHDFLGQKYGTNFIKKTFMYLRAVVKLNTSPHEIKCS